MARSGTDAQVVYVERARISRFLPRLGMARPPRSGKENRYSTTGGSIPCWYSSVFRSPWCCRSWIRTCTKMSARL